MAGGSPAFGGIIIAICIILVIAGIIMMALPDAVPKEIGDVGWAVLVGGIGGLILIGILKRQNIID